ncbi:MAG: hypothetical protein WCI55_16370 [Armatimonadota bacterium]
MQSQKPKNGCFIQIVYGVVVVQILVCALYFAFPFGGHSKVDSKRAACISNLKQITLAAILYAEDNNETFPGNFTFDGQTNERKFMTDLMPYSKSDTIFRCLFDTAIYEPGDQLEDRPTKVLDMTYVHTNALKRAIPNFDSGSRILKPSSIPDPASVSYLRDPIRGTEAGVPRSLHGVEQGFNISFLDGHVKRKKENYTADL